MFTALEDRDYRNFFFAQFLSNVGTWMQTVAQGWLVLELTDSAFLLGFVGFAGALLVILLMLPAGAIVDQIDRKKLLRVTQTTQALCALSLFGLTVAGRLSIWHIVAVAMAMGGATAFSSPAYQALVLDLLGDRSKLANAIAMNSLQFNLSRAIGPMIAGVVLARFGAAWCFALNALSFLPLLFVLRGPAVGKTHASATAIGTRLREGFAFVRAHRRVQLLLATVAAASFFGYPYVTLMPLFARSLFPHDPRLLGTLLGVIGIGALAGALILARASGSDGNRGVIILSALALFGAALLGVASFRNFMLLSAALFLAGTSMVVCLASVNTRLQQTIPDFIRGRVLSMYTFAFFGVFPLGNLAAGICAERWGIAPTFRLMGGGLIVSTLLIGALIRFSRDGHEKAIEAREGVPSA